MTLTEFLLARIADDEATAKAVTDFFYSEGRWRWGYSLPVKSALVDERGVVMVATQHDGPTWMVCDHIARHDPARVLAECEAKRRIVEIHAPDRLEPDICSTCASHAETYPCRTLRALASIYSDHPDY